MPRPLLMWCGAKKRRKKLTEYADAIRVAVGIAGVIVLAVACVYLVLWFIVHKMRDGDR